MGKHLAETTALLRWRYANIFFAFIAVISASSAMALPGPGGDVTGFASVLLVGAIALIAGHAWGILVIAAAEVTILGKVWPIVMDAITTGELGTMTTATAGTALISALPGLALFMVTLPTTVEIILGEKDSRFQRPAVALSAGATLFWLVQPALFWG